MSTGLPQAEADLFRALGHPLRLQVLDLLADGPRSVRELLAEVDAGPACLSQQLAVLRGLGIVMARRDSSTAIYSLNSHEVPDLLRATRRALTGILASQVEKEEP